MGQRPMLPRDEASETLMIGSTTNHLNAASFASHRERSPYGGAAFAAINALASATAGGHDGLNAATVGSDQLLSDLNHFRMAPQLAAAIAGLNRAQRDESEQAQAEAIDDTRRQELTRQAQKLVSQTFFGAMLKQMRNSPFKSELFSGGRGGEMFHSLMDQHLADRMASGSGNGLVQSIVRHLEKMSGRYRQAMQEEDRAAHPRPEGPNPFENVRVHVSPDLGN